jgi:hypothetical protein
MKVLHVEAIRSPRARALLLLQPDGFFGDVGEVLDGRHTAGVDQGRTRADRSASGQRNKCRLNVTHFTRVCSIPH